MTIKGFAGAAAAALMGCAMSAPAIAETPGLAASAEQGSVSITSAVQAHYSHHGRSLWVENGRANAAALALLAALDSAALDGLASGPRLAGSARGLLARAQAGDAAAAKEAEHLLSTAFLLYAQAMRTPPAGMEFADSWVAPRRSSPGELLATAAAARSLAAHVRAIANPNPVYAALRDAARSELAGSGRPDPRALASLERARTAPFQKRYVMVDAASATLWMVENGAIVDSMPVIVGKSETRTPMIASTIYHATLNPYWNVPADLARTLIAPRVLAEGIAYLKARKYEVLDGYGANAQVIDPASVDWAAVAAGTTTVRVRQQPGPANSMGDVKFGFPNQSDIFLHDTPNKDLFAASSRSLSNGCIRLSDAPRLARWLMGRDPVQSGAAPEQHVTLPTPVPIFITYTTAIADNGGLRYVADVYGKDSAAGMAIAARR